jgi:hypothetical protein
MYCQKIHRGFREFLWAGMPAILLWVNVPVIFLFFLPEQPPCLALTLPTRYWDFATIRSSLRA